MSAELVQGQELADAFLAMLPASGLKSAPPIVSAGRTGPVDLNAVPLGVRSKLSLIFAPNEFSWSPYLTLFNGDISAYDDDHSTADMALVGYLAQKLLSPDEVDLVFRSSKLYRPKWDEMRGATTYGHRTIAKAFQGLAVAASGGSVDAQGEGNWWSTTDPSLYRPIYVAGGMPPRKFVGPKVGSGVRLFPAAALSTLVALGAVGKTSLLMSIGAHVAAGKDWNGHSIEQHKVALFFCEETDEEISRKFSAIVNGWSPAEREAAMDNLLLVSLLGKDSRLTVIDRGQYHGTGTAEKILALLGTFNLQDGLVVLDHMQGFTSGDPNNAETATSICREANKIVDATGAAVVFAAHIAKANIKATELEQGFAVGSLAFENATRQMAGMLPMSEEDAKKYGLEAFRHEYAWLGLPKNSYGATDAGVWLRKEYSPKYHTVVMNPVQLVAPVSGPRKSANEKLADLIHAYISQHPWTTRHQLDGVAGSDGPLKASKGKVRDVLKAKIDEGVIVEYVITEADRTANSLPKQKKTVLRVKP